MESRSYGEPELQKMAAFLRERCDKGMYGLTYQEDTNKSMIRIPWQTVPRQNEDISEHFHMFKEWAYLSFRKRGNRGEQLENEALSAQKHRFRNALARADGLRQVKHLSTDHMRVYEFVDTKKERDHNENGVQRQHRNSPPSCYDTERRNSPPNYEHERMEMPHYPIHPGEYSDSNHTLEYQECWGSPMTVTSSPSQTPGYHNNVAFQPAPDMQEDRQPSLGTLIEEMINTPSPTVPYPQTTNGYTYVVPQPVQRAAVAEPMQTNYHMADALHVPSYVTSTSHVNGVSPQVAELDHHLLVKVHFRGEEVMQKPVTQSGFRLYSGNNIPDMARLLDAKQRNQLQSMTKYPAEYLFGPDHICQVEMPLIRCHTNSFSRTSQIIDNMDRGIIFLIEFPSSDMQPYADPNIPNVYAMRLCQTRVFPYDTNVQNRIELEEGGLRRLECVQIFDACEFMRQMKNWKSYSGHQPSALIHLAVGQMPKRDKAECNLVSVVISVTKARMMIDKYFEDQMEEIFISDKTSMDKAAERHKNEVQARIQIDDTVVY